MEGAGLLARWPVFARVLRIVRRLGDPEKMPLRIIVPCVGCIVAAIWVLGFYRVALTSSSLLESIDAVAPRREGEWLEESGSQLRRYMTFCINRLLCFAGFF